MFGLFFSSAIPVVSLLPIIITKETIQILSVSGIYLYFLYYIMIWSTNVVLKVPGLNHTVSLAGLWNPTLWLPSSDLWIEYAK